MYASHRVLYASGRIMTAPHHCIMTAQPDIECALLCTRLCLSLAVSVATQSIASKLHGAKFDPIRPLATIGDHCHWRPLATIGDHWRPSPDMGTVVPYCIVPVLLLKLGQYGTKFSMHSCTQSINHARPFAAIPTAVAFSDAGPAVTFYIGRHIRIYIPCSSPTWPPSTVTTQLCIVLGT